MIDREFIGYKFASSQKAIKRWEISQFANAICEKNPIYYDIEVAQKKGYRDIPIPPTFYTKMTFSGETDFFETLGIDFRKLLDGGRKFTYLTPCCAGDIITYQTRVADIIEKEGKRGKMDIITAITEGKIKETEKEIFETTIKLIVFH